MSDERRDTIAKQMAPPEKADPIGEIIAAYRTDRTEPVIPGERFWMHEALIFVAVRDHIVKEDPFKEFTLVDIYHFTKAQATQWDALFKIQPPYNIGLSFNRTYDSIAKFNSMFFNWVKDETCPFKRTGNKIKTRYSAIPGAPQVAYQMHSDVLGPKYIQEIYRSRLVEVFDRLNSRPK